MTRRRWAAAAPRRSCKRERCQHVLLTGWPIAAAFPVQDQAQRCRVPCGGAAYCHHPATVNATATSAADGLRSGFGVQLQRTNNPARHIASAGVASVAALAVVALPVAASQASGRHAALCYSMCGCRPAASAAPSAARGRSLPPAPQAAVNAPWQSWDGLQVCCILFAFYANVAHLGWGAQQAPCPAHLATAERHAHLSMGCWAANAAARSTGYVQCSPATRPSSTGRCTACLSVPVLQGRLPLTRVTNWAAPLYKQQASPATHLCTGPALSSTEPPGSTAGRCPEQPHWQGQSADRG